MVEEALIKNFMEEMRSMVEDAFKPIHERLDRLKHSRIRESQNLLHPITYPQKRLMREETSYEENFEQASRHHGSKLRRDGARDREAIKLQSTPPIQKKHDHKSLLGEKSDPWINKENQPLPQQQLSEIMAAFKAVFDVKDAEAPNQQEEIVELETVVGSKDENGPRELVLEIDVADSRDEKCPREMVIRVDEEVDVKDDGDDHTMLNSEESCEDVLEVSNASTLGAEAKSIEEEQQNNIFPTRCDVVDKVCSLIIDDQTYTNDATITMVENLGLTLLKHPKLQWMNETGVDETAKEVKVPFQISKYEGEVFIEEASMLEPSWLFRRQMKHDDIFSKHYIVFNIQEKNTKYKKDAQGSKHLVQHLFLARRENLIFDPGIWSDDVDLRTNPFQEEGNDVIHGGPRSLHMKADLIESFN